MSTVDPVAAATAVDIETAAPPRSTIRYRKEWGHAGHHHVSVDFSAITPGDIGGLYAALSEAITADLVRRESSSKSSSKVSSKAAPERMLPLNCDIKVELCRLLDDQGRLYIPPVKDTSVFRQKYAQLQGGGGTDKTYELLAFLLDRDVKKSWEHLQDGLFFEEGEGWPWYSLLVSYSHGRCFLEL